MTVDTPSVGDASFDKAPAGVVVPGASFEGAIAAVQPDNPAMQAAVAAAEAVLAQRFGSAIKLVEFTVLEGSGPATVVRARVAASPFSLPRTVVLKHYPQLPAKGQIDPFAQEAVSYQLFTALPSGERMCPELLAHGGKHRVLVIEDLGRAPTLRDKLHGRDAAAAERALLAWARSLAKLHATTASREADFDALFRRLSGSSRKPDAVSDVIVAEFPRLLKEKLAVATSDVVLQEAEKAVTAHRSNRFRAFSPVDLSPDNNLVTSGGVRFLDFERGLVRSAFADAAHLRVPFLSDPGVLALPKGMSEAMIAVWRAEVLAVWPELAEDALFSQRLFYSQLLQLWVLTHDFLLAAAPAQPDEGRLSEEAVLVGVSGSRPAALIQWWSELAVEANNIGLTEVSEHATAVAAALQMRYPAGEFPLFPAFRH